MLLSSVAFALNLGAFCVLKTRHVSSSFLPDSADSGGDPEGGVESARLLDVLLPLLAPLRLQLPLPSAHQHLLLGLPSLQLRPGSLLPEDIIAQALLTHHVTTLSDSCLLHLCSHRLSRVVLETFVCSRKSSAFTVITPSRSMTEIEQSELRRA